jgi:hypothetical protein
VFLPQVGHDIGMSTYTVGSLAREIGVEPKQLIVHLRALGAQVSSTSHKVDPKLAEAIRAIPDMIAGARRPFQAHPRSGSAIGMFRKEQAGGGVERTKKYGRTPREKESKKVARFAQVEFVEHDLPPGVHLQVSTTPLPVAAFDESSAIALATLERAVLAIEETKRVMDRRMHFYLTTLKRHDRVLDKLEATFSIRPNSTDKE